MHILKTCVPLRKSIYNLSIAHFKTSPIQYSRLKRIIRQACIQLLLKPFFKTRSLPLHQSLSWFSLKVNLLLRWSSSLPLSPASL